jgi:hypothetical protein
MSTIDKPREDSALSLSLLERLTERLASPDLTAAEANVLRPSLLSLLESIENADAGTHFDESNLAGELTIAGCAERCAVA